MRIYYSEEEERPGQFALFHANTRRSIRGKRGQAALREMLAALEAMGLAQGRRIRGVECLWAARERQEPAT